MERIRHNLARKVMPFPVPYQGLWLYGPRLQIVKNNSFEPEVRDFFLNPITSKSCFADVGAGYGIHSLVIAKKANLRTGKIYAFEPSLDTRRMLIKNVKLNGFGQLITVENLFVGENTGVELEFDNSMLSGVSFSGSPKDISFVKSMRLDDYGVDFDLVKIDAEGADLMVLEGCTRLISMGCSFSIEISRDLIMIDIFEYLEKIRGLGLCLRELPNAETRLTNDQIIDLVNKKKHINVGALPI